MIRFRVLTGLAALGLLCGCHSGGVKKSAPDCGKNQDYLRAREMPPLKVPDGMNSPNTKDALVIPTLESPPPPRGPNDPCLDEPPRYQPPPGGNKTPGG
jgi:uncharacterized lipoprotein